MKKYNIKKYLAIAMLPILANSNTSIKSVDYRKIVIYSGVVTVCVGTLIGSGFLIKYLTSKEITNPNPGDSNPDSPRVKTLVKKIDQDFGFIFDLVNKYEGDAKKLNNELKKYVIAGKDIDNLAFVIGLYKNESIDFDKIAVNGNILEWHKNQSSVRFELNDDILSIKSELDGYTGKDAADYYEIKKLAD